MYNHAVAISPVAVPGGYNARIETVGAQVFHSHKTFETIKEAEVYGEFMANRYDSAVAALVAAENDTYGEDQKLVLSDLYARRAMALFCIQTASETPLEDPRREGAIAEYNRQLATIDARIAEIEGKPPATVIGLKPAVLFPKAGGIDK